MRESLRALRVMVTMTFRADPRRAVLCFLLEPSYRLATPLFGLWMKLLADAAVAADGGTAWRAALGMAATMSGLWLAAGTGVRIRLTLSERVGFAFDRRIAELTGGIRGLEHQERPEYLDKLELLRTTQGSLMNSVDVLVQVLGLLVQITGTALLLASVHPVMLVLPAFGLPSLWAGAVAQTRAQRAEEDTADDRRLARHLFELGIGAGPAKEVRVFRLATELRRRHREVWLRGHARRVRARWRGTLWTSTAWAFFAVGFVAAIAFVARQAALGAATPGDVLLAVTLASQVNNDLTWAVGTIAWMLQTVKTAGWFVWLMDYARSSDEAVASPAAVPDELREGIVLEDVSFRYPGTEEWVLRDVSLRLGAGSTVALVGENGAGKTTLVKLLCRFYDPDSGRILVDGVPLDRLPAPEWRERVSGAFQDFCRFELLAKEAVGVGDLPRVDDLVAVRAALGRAGAEEVPAQLPHGLDTQLGITWDGGADLSVGQWQKLALGRGLMRERPLLLVFDEPTAALDAETEHALFERFAAASRSGGGARVITLLVSHRFSTVRSADLIVVIDGGRVTESGSHGELMERGGLYAELYTLQAKAYR